MEQDEIWGDECATPPGPGAAALMAAADGEADEETLRHLAACPTCARRVEQLMAIQRELRRQLYRFLCPTTDLLVDYCQGLLEPPAHARLAHHIALCPHCAAEVALLERAAFDHPYTPQGPVLLLSTRPS